MRPNGVTPEDAGVTLQFHAGRQRAGASDHGLQALTPVGSSTVTPSQAAST
jgi:hypothetical protein